MFNLFWWWFSFEVTLLYFALNNYFFYSIQVFFQFRFMLHIYIYIHIYIRSLDNLHTQFLLSYIFILYSPQTVEWWIERHNFCGVCCLYTSSANKLFLEWNASTTIFHEQFAMSLKLLCSSILRLWLVLCGSNSTVKVKDI